MRFIPAQAERTRTYSQRLYDLSVTPALRALSATSPSEYHGDYYGEMLLANMQRDVPMGIEP
ncbi:hypothetical protein ABRP70_02160 [Pectobacterium odoriferum]|uniref:hypothetical protein n=1 Tax=Pectobacterium odoriferum TaxID=78398 RepID=UPI000B0AEDC7|nr:hypothetical protein [Pectobacterium odoriferum]